MKTCPKCGTQYTDDTLRFCLQDGAVLASRPELGVDDEVLTKYRSSERGNGADDSRITQVAARSAAVSGTNKTGFVVVLAILAAFVLGAFGLAYLILINNLPSRRQNDNSSGKNVNIVVATPTVTPKSKPSATPSISNTNINNSGIVDRPTPPPTPMPTPEIDLGQERVAVMRQVQQWKDATESGNLASLMNSYALTVDYYNSCGASSATVQADKQRAYKLYSSVSVDISDLNISVASTGETATATFDKEWVFGGVKRSTGKVRSQLTMRKFGARWLITGERDLKLYYKR